MQTLCKPVAEMVTKQIVCPVVTTKQYDNKNQCIIVTIIQLVDRLFKCKI